MDCQNVLRRSRRRGVRGTRAERGGAMRSSGADVCEHVVLRALDEINNIDVETLSSDQPQEPCQKRRRVCSPINNIDVATLSSDQPQEPCQKRRGVCSPFVVCSGSPATSPTSSLSTKQSEGTAQPQQESLSYGSELEMTDESDDEDLVPLIPRTVRSLMDIPLDEGATPPAASHWPTTSSEDCTTSAATISASYETPLGPSFYDFQWTSFPDPCIPPESRRETFSNSNVGPAVPCVDPYDTFTNIWDRQIMEHIASATNRYAQEVARQQCHTNGLHPSSRIASWRDTTVEELYVYFAILLAMGVVVKSRFEEYWSSATDIFCTPGFSTQMSLRRFQLLNKCIHFNNNEDMRAAKLDISEAKLFKIKPVVEHLNKKFQECYNLGQNIVLDKSLLLGKSLNIDQSILNKAASASIKTSELCESQTGYLWRFEVHTKQSRAQAQDPLESFTSAIVLRLIQGLENKGHTLWMDDYYNSPALARKLKTLGFDCVGTLHTDCQFMPEPLSELTTGNMYTGQVAGLTSGDVDVMIWRDQHQVACMISTYHGNAVAASGESNKPTMILDYNIMMGGVDKKDKMLSMYPLERRRTNVWYKKFFRRLLNVSVFNAYILCKSSFKDHHLFRTSLINSILEKHGASSITTIVPIHKKQDIFEVKYHHLDMYPFLSNHAGRIRRRCVSCKKRVNTFCVGCNKTVCMKPCFVSLHS